MKLLYTIPETCETIGLRKSSIYELIGAGRLDARKAGGRTLITRESIEAFASELPRSAACAACAA